MYVFPRQEEKSQIALRRVETVSVKMKDESSGKIPLLQGARWVDQMKQV